MQHSTSQFLRTSPISNHNEYSISVGKKQETWITSAEMPLTCTPKPAPLCLLIVPTESNSPHKILTISESERLPQVRCSTVSKDAQNARDYGGTPKNIPLYLKLYAVKHRWVTRLELPSKDLNRSRRVRILGVCSDASSDLPWRLRVSNLRIVGWWLP